MQSPTLGLVGRMPLISRPDVVLSTFTAARVTRTAAPPRARHACRLRRQGCGHVWTQAKDGSRSQPLQLLV